MALGMGYICFFALLLSIYTPIQAQAKISENTFGEIEARHLGPAVMSGRIAALDALNSDPRVVYVGAASGGVWKSKNGGVTFNPIFDDHPQSIGAICIDQAQAETVWVGTGEPWTRNSTSLGKGVYKTTNGGESWTLMGLEGTERIARIRVHPTNSDIVFVAALGQLWNSNEERGIFMTTDGGTTWQKVLYIDENTGCSDLIIDPQNPDIIYAGMWDFRRTAYDFRSGGPGSGLYKSTDGGKTWKQINKGLPEGTLGRIAVSASPVAPYYVYALIESEKSALYRSTDSGENWEMASNAPAMGTRPFYFSNIIADPQNGERVYKPGFITFVSNDGGQTFTTPTVEGGGFHVDHHALWIAPSNNEYMYIGTDGGLYISNDKGNTWRFAKNLPISQFYHVSADMEKPYNVFGGLQDNGSWIGPSRAPGGIGSNNWENIGFGDGFNVLADPSDNNILYWEYQGGNIMRYYKNTGSFKQIRPYAENAEDQLRFNWNTPIVFNDAGNTLYAGAQYLFKTTDKGETWEKISPDLTTNDPKKLQQEDSGGLTLDNSTAENHCTIITISESPANNKIIWVGTDDGNVQVTKNGGKKWENVTANLRGVPTATWVSYVEASRYDASTAYVTLDGHRNGDQTSYVFKTTDLGKTWTALATEVIEGNCRIIREDIVNPNLLFLGTEFGLFVSIDGGGEWVRFKGKVPRVPIHDMLIHPRENDLIIGTHGRGIMIVDDISPLRQISTDLLEKDVAFLKTQPYLIRTPGGIQSFPGDDEFFGDNPTSFAQITYYLKKRHIFGNMYIEIYDPNGTKLQTLPAGKRKGINRVRWATRKKPPKVPASPSLAAQAMFGPTMPPGDYTIKIVKGDDVYESKLSLQFPLDEPYTAEDRKVRFEAVNRAYRFLEDLAFLDRQVTDIQEKASAKAQETQDKSLSERLQKMAALMDKTHKYLVATREGNITGEVRLREKLSEVYGAISNYSGKPTNSQLDRLAVIAADLKKVQSQIAKVIGEEIPTLNKDLETAGLTPLSIITKAAFEQEAQQSGGTPQPNKEHRKWGLFMEDMFSGFGLR